MTSKTVKVMALRLPLELHSALSTYASGNFMSVHTAVLQAIAAHIGFNSPEAVKARAVVAAIERHRAAKATPVKLERDPLVGGEWMDLEE